MRTVVFPKLLVKNFLLFSAIFALFLLILFLSALSPSKEQSSSLNAIFEKGNFTQFSSFVEKDGVEKAYQLLKMRFPKNEAAAHDFAHIIGLSAYEEIGSSGLRVCDNAYNYGCYHGFIEGFLARKGIEAVKEIEGSCQSLGKVHAPSCLHGIGHGVMAKRSYRLDQALADCDLLQKDVQLYCFDGVFMERITGSMLADKNRFTLTPQTLNEPCNSLASKYKRQCFRNQVTAWFVYFQGDSQKVGNQCRQIAKIYQDICFESVGHMIIINASLDGNKIANLCRVEKNNQISDQCLLGAMDELMFEGQSPQLAQSLCFHTSPKVKPTCQSRFQELLNDYRIRFKN